MSKGDTYLDPYTNEGRVYAALLKEFKDLEKIPRNSKIVKVEFTRVETFSPDFLIKQLDFLYIEAKGKLWKERRGTYEKMAKAGLLNRVVFLFYWNTKPPGLKITALDWAKKFGIKAIDVSSLDGVTKERVLTDVGYKYLLIFTAKGRKNLVKRLQELA